MSRPANTEGYHGPAWLWYTLVRPLTSARDCPYTIDEGLAYTAEFGQGLV